MNLIIDAGNTFVKLAVFNNKKLVFNESFDRKNFLKKVKSVFKIYNKIDFTIVSAVGHLNKSHITELKRHSQVHILDHISNIPFKNDYATPKSLGVDRIALATAAFYSKPNCNVLIIDAGSCITYDLITDSGNYLGGAISPGLQMRYKALHQQTAKLPILKLELPKNLIGTSTAESIHSGVVNGVLTEIDGLIDKYKTQFKDLTVILTGGDAQLLSKRLKNTIFADSNFLLEGLNFLLEYNKH